MSFLLVSSGRHIGRSGFVNGGDGCRRKDVTWTIRSWLAEQFEEHRPHLRAVAYRMLGSLSEADDAVQEAWLRLSRSDAATVANLGGWLTTVVGRVCLDMLRARRSRQRGVRRAAGCPSRSSAWTTHADPEQEAMLADSLGLALLVVLETLTPAERLAFVLHDMFGVPFDEIAAIVDRTPDAARQLASRARRRVRGAAPEPDADLGASARGRRRVPRGRARGRLRGAAWRCSTPRSCSASTPGSASAPGRRSREREAVARAGRSRARRASRRSRARRSSTATAGFVVGREGRPIAVVGFTVVRERIVAIDIVTDPDKLHMLGA